MQGLNPVGKTENLGPQPLTTVLQVLRRRLQLGNRRRAEEVMRRVKRAAAKTKATGVMETVMMTRGATTMLAPAKMGPLGSGLVVGRHRETLERHQARTPASSLCNDGFLLFHPR
jgi:hypothetical protein